jgi:RNA polymerase sigma-70 factor (ECF subfamily)
VFGATMSGRVADPAETATARVDVDTALGRLTLDARSAIVLRDFCDLSYEEIAEIVGVPIGTVRSRIARARATLADFLGDSRLDASPSEGHRESSGNPATASHVKPCEDEARRPTPRATKP